MVKIGDVARQQRAAILDLSDHLIEIRIGTQEIFILEDAVGFIRGGVALIRLVKFQLRS